MERLRRKKRSRRRTKKKDKKEKKGKVAEKKEKDEKQEKKDKEKKSKAAVADQEKAQALVDIEEESGEQDEHEKEAADGSEGKVLRDAKKAWFFHRHFAELPDSVQSLFNAKDLSRKQKSELVNSTVTKDASGSWVLQPDNPTVSALSSIFKKVIGGESFVLI